MLPCGHIRIIIDVFVAAQNAIRDRGSLLKNKKQTFQCMQQ